MKREKMSSKLVTILSNILKIDLSAMEECIETNNKNTHHNNVMLSEVILPSMEDVLHCNKLLQDMESLSLRDMAASLLNAE